MTSDGVASRSPLSNAGWNVFGAVSNIAISFLIAPILIHNMGTDHYGILLLIWSVTGILGLVGFGFGEATLRYMAHYFGEGSLAGVNRIMGSTLSLYLVVSLLVCAALFVVAPRLAATFSIPASEHELVSWLLRLAAVCFALRTVSLSYGAIPMALHRYDISNKIGIVQSAVRSAGYILLAIAGFGLVHIILWDVATLLGVLVIQAVVIRKMAPGVSLLPSLSFAGLREIAGFSIFSFLTYAFHMMHREAGKLMVGAQIGASPVAYLGTPDNVSQRLHMVVASGSETLMPRFSATKDPHAARSLFLHGTWASVAVSLVLLLPLILLMPDFLRLWINAEFARESAAVGQLVALSYVSQGAYAPAATYFRGIGKPWMVTVVIALAGLTMLLGCFILIPRLGTIGVGYAYVLASIPPLLGVVHAWFFICGRSSVGEMGRRLILPVVMSCVAYSLCLGILPRVQHVGWLGLIVLGALFFGITSALVFGSDLALGGDDASSKQFLQRVMESRRLAPLARLLRARRAC